MTSRCGALHRAMPALVLSLALALALAPAASANIGGLFPTDEDGGTAIESISTAQNLFAYTLSDVQGGDVCVVPAALENPGNGSLNCANPAWGSSNRVIGVGSSWTLIEVPYLRAGHWKLLADGGSENSVDVFSNDFTVVPCEPGACDRRLAQETAARYKAAAAQMAISMAGMNATIMLLTKINPDEPFDHFKNALNKAVKAAGESSSLYIRVLADEAKRKLEFVTRIPSGPHAMALALAHQVAADALEMYLDIVHDPPQDYATVAQPEFDLPVFPTNDADIDGLMLDLAQVAGYGAAGLTAYERYQQAALEDSDPGVHRQAAAMGRFDGQLAAEMWSSAAGLDAWAAKLEADPEYGGATVTQEHVDALRPFLQRVRDSGLTAEERQEAQDAGLNAAQIADVADDLATVDLDDVQVGVPVEQLARSLADELRDQAPAFDAMARDAEAVAQTTDSPPVASFSATPASGAPPLHVSFQDTSVHADDDPLEITWDFGDGSAPATGPSVSHTFSGGTFVVTQTVSDGVSTSTATRTIVALAPNEPPVADIARSPAQGDAPLSVDFDASGSSDPDGDIMAFDWAFGDGSTAQGPTVSHIYGTPGNYTATLTVTDDHGTTATATAGIVVHEPPPGNLPPVAVADTLVTSQGAERTINVLTNDSDANGDALHVAGTTPPAHGTVTCEPAGDCTYVPDDGFSGSDAFSYVVEDAAGARTTGHVAITVNAVNQAPTADAGPDQDVAQDDNAQFDGGGSEDSDGTIATYEWDFGDGTDPVASAQASITHVYGRPGTFTARLIVTDDAGLSSEDTVLVNVANVAPSISLTAFPRAPVGVSRSYQATVGTGLYEPTTVSVDFGDGSSPVSNEAVGNDTHSFEHAYSVAGVYTVTFTATDSAGETISAHDSVTVANATADAGPDKTAGEGSLVHLNGAGTPTDQYTSATWDFGDGSDLAGGVQQEHAYRDEGEYTATYTVTDEGGTISDTARISVSNVAPTASISASRGGGPGEAVSLRGFAQDRGTADVLSYAWSFGDGSTGAGRNVEHSYAAAGTYGVELRVEDGDGGTVTTDTSIVVGGATGRRDSRGADFWLTFPTNYSGEPALTLFIAGETATSGSVDIPGLDFSADYTVTPGQATTVPLPHQAQLDAAKWTPQDLGIHVTAGADVSVYGLNRIKFTTDAFLGLPTNALGTTYRVISYDAAFGAGPEAAVVATANATTVTITPSAALNNGKPAGEPFEVELDMGEAYQMVANADLTGSLITSDKPVAAFGGHNCANVPVHVSYCDHLVEQLTPIDSWGRRFATMPLATRSGGDTFRVLAAEEDTTVSINGEPVATLGAGGFHEQLIEGPATIDADKPILVVQYSNGSSFDSTISDPFMVIIPPNEQFQAGYTVATPASGFAHNFLNLVVPSAAAAAVRLDGELIPEGTFQPIGDSGLAGAQIEVGLGDHRIESPLPFGVIVYGFDSDDSYGYGGGLAMGEVATVSELRLSPESEDLEIGSRGCVEATALTDADDAVEDVRIDFSVSGANPDNGFTSTGNDGVARFCYSGGTLGEDTIRASLGALSRTATKRWRPPNHGPVAVDDDVGNTPAGTALAIPVATLLANDSDPDGDSIKVAGVAATPASHGTATLAGNTVTYTPGEGYSGDAAFRYTISDGHGGSAEATVKVSVVPKQVIVDPPPAPPAPEPPAGEVKGETVTSADLLLGCTERLVVLEDVVPERRRVRFVGVADRRFAGQPVAISFAPTAKVVARPTVGADGSFSATAPLPPKRLRNSNLARYEARIGEHRSLKLKLARRMVIESITASSGKVTITGRVVGPLAARRADRAIELERRVSCSRNARVARTMPRANGTFRLSITAPAGQASAVYRLRTKVRRSPSTSRSVNTFTLPRGIDF